MAFILNKAEAFNLYCKVKKERRALHNCPTLAIMQIGRRPIDDALVYDEITKASEIGIACLYAHYPEHGLQNAKATMAAWASDPEVNGIILHSSTEEQMQLEALIPVSKDVGGILENSPYTACVNSSILTLLRRCQSSISEQHVVVVGCFTIVDRLLIDLLIRRGYVATFCHSEIDNLHIYTKQADVLIVTAGKPGSIVGNMIKPGSAVIDAGFNYEGGKIVGAVDLKTVEETARRIAPVGCTESIAIVSLMSNVLAAWKLQNEKVT
ncbi:MAG: hypothetical protein J6S14_20865 [Clostridia bacterium]|nr:hypothetical protein [Clostridia bacterium]